MRMMDQSIKPKLNSNSESLLNSLLDALQLGPMVYLDVQAYAKATGVHVRSAQRYAKAVAGCPQIQFIKRHQNLRYFGRLDADWRELHGFSHEYVQAKMFQNGSSVVPVVPVVPLS